MRTTIPNEESVMTLMGCVTMERKAFDREVEEYRLMFISAGMLSIAEFYILEAKK